MLGSIQSFQQWDNLVYIVCIETQPGHYILDQEYVAYFYQTAHRLNIQNVH